MKMDHQNTANLQTIAKIIGKSETNGDDTAVCFRIRWEWTSGKAEKRAKKMPEGTLSATGMSLTQINGESED